VQILWINIVTEGTVTVNLVMDPPDGDEMRRPPVPRDDPLLDRCCWRACADGADDGGGHLRLVRLAAGQGVPVDLVRTETFTLLAMCQWFNVLNCQSATATALGARLLRNRWLAAGCR
jgi:magnesium-transporting ATPase (P-type)